MLDLDPITESMNTNASKFQTKADLDDWKIEGIDYGDAPDFGDAYVSYATCAKTGRELTEEELINLPSDLVYELVESWVY